MHFILIMLLPTQMDKVDERVCKLAVSWSGAVPRVFGLLRGCQGTTLLQRRVSVYEADPKG